MHFVFITGTFFAERATICPTDFSSRLTPFMCESKQTELLLETFLVNVLYYSDYKKVYKCQGIYILTNPTDVNNFSDSYNCSNKGKIPIETKLK
jgi:hypothetical protein